MELPLVVAAVPALAVQRLQRAPALLDPVERAHAAARGPALRELFHRAQRLLRRRWAVGCFVGVVEGLEREHGWWGCAVDCFSSVQGPTAAHASRFGVWRAIKNNMRHARPYSRGVAAGVECGKPLIKRAARVRDGNDDDATEAIALGCGG